MINLLLCVSLFLLTKCNWYEQSYTYSKKVSKRIFHSSTEEKLKPTIWDIGDTTVSNEDRYDLFLKHIKDLRGGYFGVGSIQNLTFSAWAKSDWVWLMDFTRIVVAVNKIHIAFLKNALNPEEFDELWLKKNSKRAKRILKEEYGDEIDYPFISSKMEIARNYFQQRARLMKRLALKRNYTIWLKDQQDYDHLRKLALRGRIRSLKGDIAGKVTVSGIAKAAKKMQVPLRVIYFSNAEEYLKYSFKKKGYDIHGYSKQFRSNWIAIPTDELSVIIRTFSQSNHIYTWPEDSHHSTNKGFHYNIMSVKLFKDWLLYKGHVSVAILMENSHVFREKGYSIIKKKPPSPAAL